MSNQDLSAISNEEFERNQRVLDIDKWLASEKAGKDLCGNMSWCKFCVKSEMHPCAKAQFREKLQVAMREIIVQEERIGEVAGDNLAADKGGAANTAEALAAAAEEEAAASDLSSEAEPPDGYEKVIRMRRAFLSRIIQSDRLQDMYTEIKNAVLGFGGVKSRLCFSCENFRVGKTKIAKLCVRGKTLSIFLALDPSEFEYTHFRFEDVSDKKSYADTPMRIKLTSRRSLKQAKELLEILAHKFELMNVGCIFTDFHFGYKTDDELIACGLIKPYSALVRIRKN